jgi:ATP phosphoribosyltransferase regulatory subunit HisZ
MRAVADSTQNNPTRRRRLTALLDQQRFNQLEQLALQSGRSNSIVAAMILNQVLDQHASAWEDSWARESNADVQ